MTKKTTKKSAKKRAPIQRPWLKSYPDVVGHELSDLKHLSVAGLIEHACQKYSTHVAFSCMGKNMTYQ